MNELDEIYKSIANFLISRGYKPVLLERASKSIGGILFIENPFNLVFEINVYKRLDTENSERIYICFGLLSVDNYLFFADDVSIALSDIISSKCNSLDVLIGDFEKQFKDIINRGKLYKELFYVKEPECLIQDFATQEHCNIKNFN